jgi:hypothetical protein
LVLETTYKIKEHNQLIEDIVGKPFSIFEAFRRGGIGSKRLIVNNFSPNLNFITNSVSDINYANIELRKQGILVMINKGLKNFTWAIPFYQLVFFKSDLSSIHAQGKFIQFANSKTFKENKKFFVEIMNEKLKFDEKYSHPKL